MLKKFQKNTMLWLIGVIGFSAFFLFFDLTSLDQKAKIIFFDVGQGDAILIISPNGRQILIDAGKYTDISIKLKKYMPLSDRSLNMVIATHPDIDHVAGFDTILSEYSVESFVHSGLLAGSSVYTSIAKKVREQKIQTHTAIAGEKIFIDTDMYLEILSPYQGQKIDKPNDHSIVMRLVYRNKAIMLTGDAPRFVEQNIVNFYGENIESSILKLGHHGSKTSSSSLFINKVNPQYAVISAACNNRFGHPNELVLQTLEDYDIKSLSTCEQGDIVFEFEDSGWVLNK